MFLRIGINSASERNVESARTSSRPKSERTCPAQRGLLRLGLIGIAALGSLACQEDGTSAEQSSSWGGASGFGGEPNGGNAGTAGSKSDGQPNERSCVGGLACGDYSCCDSLVVAGGTFRMGRGADGEDVFEGAADETPEHFAKVGTFSLDRFEVTVGRFRRFVEDFHGPPAAETGAHEDIPQTGWEPHWDGTIPTDKQALLKEVNCGPPFSTWTDDEGPNENMPINCISWYLAFTFCAWDGGRLPTEAEWEYAAAGGDENRLYPWGSTPADNTRAVANCSQVDSNGNSTCALLPVGSLGPSAEARWGHADMAGNVAEWVLDYYSTYDEALCDNCCQTSRQSSSDRVFRGGHFGSGWNSVRAAARDSDWGSLPYPFFGFRCVKPTYTAP